MMAFYESSSRFRISLCVASFGLIVYVVSSAEEKEVNDLLVTCAMRAHCMTSKFTCLLLHS